MRKQEDDRVRLRRETTEDDVDNTLEILSFALGMCYRGFAEAHLEGHVSSAIPDFLFWIMLV